MNAVKIPMGVDPPHAGHDRIRVTPSLQETAHGPRHHHALEVPAQRWERMWACRRAEHVVGVRTLAAQSRIAR